MVQGTDYRVSCAWYLVSGASRLAPGVLRGRAAMMESFSRTLDTYTGSYVARRRRRRLLVVALASLVLLAIVGVGVLLVRPDGPLGGASKPMPKRELLAKFQAHDWDTVLAASETALASFPLDPFYLGMKGLSSFYKAIELPEGEERTVLIDQAVAALRKALVADERTSRVLPRAEFEYVLGKAYFCKGAAYYDGAVKWLESSIQDGYLGPDSREYLAVAYAGIGDRAAAIRNFEAALQRSRADLLLLAAARAYKDYGQADRAESLLLEALATSQDALAREKCRYALADIYGERSEDAKAEEQLMLALKENAESAEAHYRLGLLYQKRGDPVRARAEWRRAVAIDPMHTASRQKLTEKL